jgi:hypothetical protein
MTKWIKAGESGLIVRTKLNDLRDLVYEISGATLGSTSGTSGSSGKNGTNGASGSSGISGTAGSSGSSIFSISGFEIVDIVDGLTYNIILSGGTLVINT